jgi:siroheme synthase-like protein
VGARRAHALVAAGFHVVWVAPDAPSTPGPIDIRRRPFAPDDLSGCAIVFACAPPAVNAAVADAARAQRVLCGRADQPDAGDFVVPAQMERGGAVLSVSTERAGPSAARTLLGALGAAWRPSFDTFLRLWTEARTALPPGADRQRAARSVANDEILSMLDAGDVEGARARLRTSLAAGGEAPTETT